ncbi:MAG TPA: DNA repair protein RadA [Acidimicrobiales bacterium]|jgi:DNA repair protein RadA/Sms|nr:DNA repair protein RadA [Acidimicrobiales bacterium]
MPKTVKRHRCIDCGATSAQWVGRCPTCGEWNTLIEESELDPLVQAVNELDLSSMPVPLSSVDVTEAAAIPSGVGEFDRVLTGGLVPGSVTLLGGEPGIGKSTLLLQVLAARAAAGHRVLLVSAEESAHQVRLRAERLGPVPPSLLILSVTDVGAVINAVVEAEPELVVVDSIQAVAIGPATAGERRAGGVPGSVTQVRECADQLVGLAKARQVAIVLVGHVTKDGALAGPRALEHMVDTVLSFDGDRHHALRILVAVKHRFGPTGELGLFEMGDHGLSVVDDPGRLLLGDRITGVPGGIVLPAMQGRRTLLVELQALVATGVTAQSKRSVVGLDAGRLTMILAVLDRHVGIPFLGYDVFASVAGGIRVTEPAADLALALAVASASMGVPLPPDLAAVGEIGLAGEVRQVTNLPRRLEEASRLGFTRVVVPASSPAGPPGVELIRVETVKDAFLQQLGQRPLPERGEWRSEDPGDWIDEDGQLL